MKKIELRNEPGEVERAKIFIPPSLFALKGQWSQFLLKLKKSRKNKNKGRINLRMPFFDLTGSVLTANHHKKDKEMVY